jgi:hypothetical protein
LAAPSRSSLPTTSDPAGEPPAWAAALVLVLAFVGCPALARDLEHAVGVESRRQQTQLRFQQALRDAREVPPASRDGTDRMRRERMVLEQLQSRQAREAGAVEQLAPDAPATGLRRSYTLERYRRDQHRLVDEARRP